MSLSEREIISRYFNVPELALPRPEIELGPGDDAAILRVPAGKHLVVSTDVLVAGIHFPQDAAANLIANRALAVNLSDLAAMAAKPLCFTLALTLPRADAKWLRAFSGGLAELAGEFRCSLIGGDISRGPLQIAIQVHGLCASGRELRREGARPGQNVYVTGWVGDGALGLASLGLSSTGEASGRDGGSRSAGGPSDSAAAAPPIGFNVPAAELPEQCRAHFHAAYFRPRPRVDFALAAAPLIACAIDISDGLLGDAGHLAAAGGVGIALDPGRFPFSPPARHCAKEATRIRAALAGGDDYELCFTADPANEKELMALAAGIDLPLTRIGEVTPGAGVSCSGGEPDFSSFDHFPTQSAAGHPLPRRGMKPAVSSFDHFGSAPHE